MKVLIAGAGIGGLTAALSLHAVGIEVDVFEQARELGELGVGLNLLPHTTKELASLGLLPALGQAGIETSQLIYATRLGQVVWREARGTAAGYDMPQFSIHRGKLHGLLARAAADRLGAGHGYTGCRVVSFEESRHRVVAKIERRDDGNVFDVEGDALVGADGIHSAVRGILYPNEGPPVWSGIMLWRGATEWPVFEDGRTMVIAGGNAAKFVVYPIHADPGKPALRLTNWGVMARVARAGEPLPHREDWSRPGDVDAAMQFVRDRFRLDWVDPVPLIEATGGFYEYPNCDRDPLPRWSFGRVTLLGDAAHPMSPVGSNGAGQAILDARVLARRLSSRTRVVDALAAYDEERRPATSEIVLSNRQGGPERVIDVVEERAPDGFEDIDAIATHGERLAIVRGYARLAGYTAEQVNRG
jgi:2-polyprenyl-6-methoxyphenol hydroxylase-like FAD-dependent oxidoreductase